MKGAPRIDREGRRTFKRRPGPKQQSVTASGVLNEIIILHALVRHKGLSELFPKINGVSRNRASVAIALIEGDPLEDRPGASLPREKLAGAADTLLKKHREIMRDKTRKADRVLLDRYADLLFDAARPKRAALPAHPILATPAGVFGAGAWATKRVEKTAAKEAVRGEPSWVTAARLGALAQADGAHESHRLAQRARDELQALGFPIDEVLERLNLAQAYEQK